MECPINDKQRKELRRNNVPETLIKQSVMFLTQNDYEFYNLAILGSDYRLMFRNKKTQKVEAKLFPIRD